MQVNRSYSKLTEKKLTSLYWNKQLSTSEIAKIYNCNAETIRRLMIKFNIKRRDPLQRKYEISKEELDKLYVAKRMSTIEIAKKHGCSQWVIWSLLKKYGIKARGANDYHKWKSPTNQIKPILDPSPTLSYILGVILGDGWMYKYKHCYFVGLEALDKKFCESFKRALSKLGLNPCIFRNKRYWKVVSSSKLFYEWFKSLNLYDIKEIAKGYPISFLKGFYESDGSFSRYESKKLYKNKEYRSMRVTITIVNTKKELIDLTKELLEYLGFHSTTQKRNNGPHRKPLWALLLSRKAEVKQFLETVKPCIKTGEKRRGRNL